MVIGTEPSRGPGIAGPPIRRVMAATDGSPTAQHAVGWAAELARLHEAELVLVQVLAPGVPPGTPRSASEQADTDLAAALLTRLAQDVAGDRGRARLVVAREPVQAIVEAAETERADVLVVGNAGMTGRTQFLLHNVPNRISHAARCTVVIVNTSAAGGLRQVPSTERHPTDLNRGEPHVLARSGHIAKVFAGSLWTISPRCSVRTRSRDVAVRAAPFREHRRRRCPSPPDPAVRVRDRGGSATEVT